MMKQENYFALYNGLFIVFLFQHKKIFKQHFFTEFII